MRDRRWGRSGSGMAASVRSARAESLAFLICTDIHVRQSTPVRGTGTSSDRQREACSAAMFLIEEPTHGAHRSVPPGWLPGRRTTPRSRNRSAHLASRFAPLFRGEFETGLYPDEWNWREGRDAGDLTRQICNAWKSDRGVARAVLHPLHRPVVRAASRLAGRAHQPGQRAVEAARSPPARLSPGRQLPALGGAVRDVHLLDRARCDERRRRHDRVRGGFPPLGRLSARRAVSRSRRLRA